MARIKNRQHKIRLATTQLYEGWYKFLADVDAWTVDPTRSLCNYPDPLDYIGEHVRTLERLGVEVSEEFIGHCGK